MVKFYIEDGINKIKDISGKITKQPVKLFVLEVNENRMIVSNPSIQSFNEFNYVNRNSIMYFYYDTEIQFDREYSKFNNHSKGDLGRKPTKHDWVSIIKDDVFEFGIMRSLSEAIDFIMKYDMKDAQKEYFLIERGSDKRSETDYEGVYHYSFTGMCEEDILDFTKKCRYFESSYNPKTKCNEPKYVEWYEIYFGIGNESKENTVGFKCSRLKNEDLLVIKEWVEAFMSYAEEVEKRNIEDYLKNPPKDSDTYYVRKHIESKYPEDINDFQKIYAKLNEESFILDEYIKYIKNEEISEPLFSKWSPKKGITAKELMDKGLKDYEAYIELINFYHKNSY